MLIVYFMVFGLLTTYAYEIWLGLMGLFGDDEGEVFEFDKYRTFDIIIPCHDEENVIYNSLEAISQLEYPKDKYRVLVFIDNCKDNSEVMIDRFTVDYPAVQVVKVHVNGGSKPKCIYSGVNKLVDLDQWCADSIMILDADNRLSKTILDTFNLMHTKYDMLQCAIKSLNSDGVVANGFSIAFKMSGVMTQQSRNNIHLSALLCGTGFSVSREIFDKYKFIHCDTLTEDLEFGIKTIMSGEYIKYVSSEYVLNEHVTHFKDSVVQRIRWCRGHVQVSVKLNREIARSILKQPSVQLIDILLILNTPLKTLIMLCVSLLCPGGLAILSMVSILMILFNTLMSVVIDKHGLRTIVSKTIYSISMWFCILMGILTFRNNKWAKTSHGNNDKREN